MKAYHLNEFGSAGGMVSRDDPVPQRRSGEVLVQVHARSLNDRELRILRGPYPLPATQGVVPISDEGAGVVVAVGEGVTRLAPGDRVAATYFRRWSDGRIEPDVGMEPFGCTRDGMLAEFVLADEQAFVRVPAHLLFEEAATLPCAALTAWSAPGQRRQLPGESVLTIGSGYAALLALQFAKIFGARTIAITSSEGKAALLKHRGANEALDDRKDPDWKHLVRELTGGRGIDYVVETSSVATLPKSFAAGAWNADVALVLALTGGTLDVTARRGLVAARRIFVGSGATFEPMKRAIAQHLLRPVIDRVFPFEAVRAALRVLRAKAAGRQGRDRGSELLRHGSLLTFK
jgi:NADPH:quinone reductase-like Zn-dependent oxidoreductase